MSVFKRFALITMSLTWSLGALADQNPPIDPPAFQARFSEAVKARADLPGTAFRADWDADSPTYFGGSSFDSGIFSISLGEQAWAGENDGLAFVLCHELGHFLGGAPFKKTHAWASAEGQADFYAASVCLKRLWADDDSAIALRGQIIPDRVERQCNDRFDSAPEKALCKRTTLAGYRAIKKVLEDPALWTFTMPSFDPPDTSQVTETVLDYPSLKCRMETFLAGALERPGDSDPRPHCWFNK